MLAACYILMAMTALAASGDGPAGGGFEWAKETLRSDVAACLPLLREKGLDVDVPDRVGQRLRSGSDVN